jgi:erythritol transport system permease protein
MRVLDTSPRASVADGLGTAPTRPSAFELLLRLRAVVALALLLVVFSVLSPQFLTTGNLTILIKHVAINAILAIGMTFVIVSGGIDLSVGSVAGLSGMISGALISTGLVLAPIGQIVFFHTWLVVVIGLVAGIACGALNGALIARLRVPPFIATLGTLYVARGVAMLTSDGATFPHLGGRTELGNTAFPSLGAGTVLGVPAPIWIMAGLAALAIFITHRTVFGRHVYAIGGNERAALLAGVRVSRVKFSVYVISGGCAALVGLIIAAQLGAAHPATGGTFELNAIAAVVLGGTSLMGGRGTILGTLIGAFVIGVLADGLVLLGVSEFWQMVVKGMVIVLAVILDQFQKRSS